MDDTYTFSFSLRQRDRLGALPGKKGIKTIPAGRPVVHDATGGLVRDGELERSFRPMPFAGRRLSSVLSCSLALALPVLAECRPPNVVIVLTDDQGFGELGVTGNPIVHTPHLDRLASASTQLGDFTVMPVCSPTRAALLTGRNYYRTGITDTWLGRSLIDPAERTLAEILRDAGYRTGIFGKWHLGDNYPRRAMDQGFDESLVLNGGGLAQPGDPPDPVDERGAYFNPTMLHNGSWIKTRGYVSDVITDAALEFMEQNRREPFFLYLPFNCPHSPHQVPEKYRLGHAREDFDVRNFPSVGNPMRREQNVDTLARVYGMVENIDDNVGRVLGKLDELGLASETIVVFFSDNGSQQHGGFNAGLRDWKGSPYQGGIRQFCFFRWPQHLVAGRVVDRAAAVFDIAPTLLELCDVKPTETLAFDGRSLASLLRGEAADWPERTLVAQWHRGDVPERYRSFALRTQEWKLVQPNSRGDGWNGKTDFQLFHLSQDPYEMHNLAADEPERVEKLKAAYDAWFDDVVGGRDFSVPQRIQIGTAHENPVLLTRQDWRGPKASWSADGNGYWEVTVASSGRYDVTLRFRPEEGTSVASIRIGDTVLEQSLPPKAVDCLFNDVALSAGDSRVQAEIKTSGTVRGADYVEMLRLE